MFSRDKAIMRSSMMVSGRSLAGVALAALAVPLAMPALAAETAVAPEEILVTARKREERVQDVPIAMTVFDAEDIAARGVNALRDLEHSVPNLMFTSVDNVVSPQISLRGISSDARNIGFESGLSLYVDGVYTGRPSSFSVDMLDVAQVEVLRGPQGTLFGKNTTAGAINIITRAPSQEFEGNLELQYGNYDALRVRASASGPIVKDKLAIRVGGYMRKRDGYQHNLHTGGDLYTEDSKGAQAKLLLTPTDGFDLQIAIDGLHDRYRPNVNEMATGLGATGTPRDVDIDTPVYQERDVFGTSATANLDFGPATLTSISAYRTTDIEFLTDDDGSSNPFLTGLFKEDQEQVSQELRLASNGSTRFSWVAGLYYFHQRVTTSRLSRLTNLLPFQIDVTLDAKVLTDSYAAFGQFDYKITDALTLTGGLRYTSEKKTLDMNLVGSPLFGIATVSLSGHRYKEDDLSPTLGLAWRPNDTLNLYAKVAKGFKSGGFNADYVPSALVDFDSESATNYEAGAKYVSPDRAVRANLAVFVTDYRDLQVIQFQQFAGFNISNAAEATIKGVELDFEASPIAGLRFDGSVGYLDATFDSFKDAGGAGVDYDGNRLPEAPRWTASFGAQYTHDVGVGSVTLRGDMTYRAHYFVDPENAPADRISGYTLYSARLGFTTADGGWTVELWGKNLANKRYMNARGTPVLGGLLGQEYVNYGAPRTYGVRLAAAF